MSPVPEERYERAWKIPGPDGGGVLVQQGSEKDPYWWVLCPASATLYMSTESLIAEGRTGDCSIGASCEYEEVHRAAAEIAHALPGGCICLTVHDAQGVVSDDQLDEEWRASLVRLERGRWWTYPGSEPLRAYRAVVEEQIRRECAAELLATRREVGATFASFAQRSGTWIDELAGRWSGQGAPGDTPPDGG